MQKLGVQNFFAPLAKLWRFS